MRILPAAFRGCDRARDGESEQRADQRRPVAKTHIGRRSGVALGGYLEPACGELRQLREHAPVAVDRGSDAASGGAQVHASGLDRAQARDLQVLRGRQRVAEPCNVGGVDQQGRFRQRARDFIAEGVLVADVDRDALAGDRKRGLREAAAGEIRQRDLQHVQHPAEAWRHELAERHEMYFVINLARCRAERDHAVVVPVLSLAVRNAEQQVAAVAFRRGVKAREVPGLNAIVEARHRGLGENDQPSARLLGEARVGFQNTRVALGAELHLLLDVSLQQRGANRVAGRRGPVHGPQRLADASHRDEQDEETDLFLRRQAPQHPGRTERYEGEPIHAEERRIALGRPAGSGVAGREPRKAGQNPAAQPFEQRPRCRDDEARTRAIGCRHPRLQPSRGGGEQGDECAEQERGEARQRRRHAAELAQAHVDPRHPAAEKPQPEREAAAEASSRRGAHPEMDEHGERGKRERVEADGRECEHGRSASQERDHVLALSTSSVYTRRLSARSTWKRRPSMAMVSPRLGKRPRCAITRPPTVSALSSENLVPKAALKSATCVSALTRKRPPGSGMMLSEASSKSYSSSISPTICSSTSSMVTRPETPPYSSTTIAMWLRLARKSRSSTLSRLDSGTKTAGRSVSRRLNDSGLA